MQGKVKEIRRTTGSDKPNLKFAYDGLGNRVSKTVIPKNSVNNEDSITTYYIRDAQGNILATYEKTKYKNGDEKFYLKEQYLYGSSRIGMNISNLLLASNVNGNVEIKEYDGYFTKEIGNKRYELTNHLGNVLAVVSDKKLPDNEPDVISVSDYYPFGMQMPGRLYSEPSNNYRFGFNQAEKIDEIYGSGNLYSFDFRESDPRLGGQFWSIDPLAKSYPAWSPYTFAQRRPIDGIELEGLEWKGTNDENGTPNGYQWDPENAWNTDNAGNKTLKEGYYHQAIFFSENGTFDADSKYNMGSSTATVFKANGTTQTFDATSYPSDLDNYPTVPEGRYEATVGLHKSSYTALRMHDIENINSQINLGFENPAFNDGRMTASGINIHKPGLNNLTGMTSKGSPCSAGCMLVDRNNWSTFIDLFNNKIQRSNPVGVTISRTYAQPVISKYTAPQIPFLNKSYIMQPDATRVFVPIYFNLKIKK